MDSRDIDLFASIIKERQDEILCEIKKEALLNDGTRVTGTKRKLLLALLAAIVVVAVAAGVQFFV